MCIAVQCILLIIIYLLRCSILIFLYCKSQQINFFISLGKTETNWDFKCKLYRVKGIFMHIIHALLQIFQTGVIPLYSCWLFRCHYKSSTKSSAMTSELIMAKQFNMWSLIAFETLALPRSLYLQWWVTQQQVLGEPWRVLSFCHLYDKLPRQWTWRAGTLIQFQLLTLGIRLHAFASLGKGDSPSTKRKKGKKKR